MSCKVDIYDILLDYIILILIVENEITFKNKINKHKKRPVAFFNKDLFILFWTFFDNKYLIILDNFIDYKIEHYNGKEG